MEGFLKSVLTGETIAGNTFTITDVMARISDRLGDLAPHSGEDPADALGKYIRNGCDVLAEAINNLAAAVRESGRGGR